MSAVFTPSARTATPVRYDVEATVATVSKQGREPFGSKFFFAAGGKVIYRVLPENRSDTDPPPAWSFWFAGATGTLPPVSGYESVDVVALNARGEAVGRSVSESAPGAQPHQEAALYWTPAGGSVLPAGFDPGFSGLKAISAVGEASGFTKSGTYRSVRWREGNPATFDDIPAPAGYPNVEIRGVSANGNVLLYVTTAGGATPRLAVWDGATTEVIGPAPEAGETFSASNCAINATGDAAMLLFTPGGSYRIIYIPAGNPAQYQIFSFTGGGSAAFSLQISDAGLASCQTSTNIVSIVSTSRAEQFTFAGYNPFLNATGEFIFGNQSQFFYWDAAAWTGSPGVVPLALPAAPNAPTLVGFNDEGRLLTLSDNATQTTRTLSILAPAPLPVGSITLTPISKMLRLVEEGSLRDRKLVRARASGEPEGIRYLLRGRLPRGLKFDATDGTISGRPEKNAGTTVKVAASYVSAGERKQSAFAAMRIVVSARANRPTR